MAGIWRGYTKNGWGQVHFREAGAGPALVMLHLTSAWSDMYTEMIPHLAQSRRVIALDTPGYGLSDPPPQAPGPDGYAAALAETLDALGVEQAAVFGHHTGATVALQFAADFPERTTALILSGCPDYLPERRAAQRARFTARSFAADGSTIAGMWATSTLEGTPVTPDEVDFVRRMMVGHILAGSNWHWGFSAVLDQEAPAVMRRVQCPVLSLTPELDRFISFQAPLVAQAAHGELHVIPGRTPEAIWKQPEEYAVPLLEFLDRVGG